MKFVITDGHEDRIVYRKVPENATLGSIFKDHLEYIELCEVNDILQKNWQTYKVNKKDKVNIYCKVGEVGTIVSILISLALSALATLLAPSPQKPSSSKNQPALGIAGVQNTVAPGTPKFLPYGIRRVFGHLIGSKINLRDPPRRLKNGIFGTKMDFSAMYFMGVGPILDITAIQINGTAISDIADGEPTAITRLGTDDQEIIDGHEFVHMVYSDNRPMDARTKQDRRERAARSLIYTTKGDNVNRIALFYQFPQGLWANNTGVLNGQSYSVRVEGKQHGVDCDWIDLGLYTTPRRAIQRAFFWEIDIELPSPARWDIRQTVEKQDSYRSTTAGFNLFNVQETQYITTTYPGNALLEIHGVASDQITSFEQMQTSALVCGRFVDVYTNGVYVKQFSRNRVWIIRDLLFNSDVGLGNRLSSSLWDNGAGAVAAAYYEEQVAGFDGDEQRDYCDVIINETRPGSDWIKTLLFEGNATIIPSSGRLKYLVDRDKSPNLLYSSPGNIIENTLQYQRGSAEKPINTIRAEFPDEAAEYKVVPVKYPSSVNEPEKSETMSLASITRESEASRLMQFRLKYLTLIKDRWTWKSPSTAFVSEPYDVEKLAYQVSEGLRGYVGHFTNDASTASKLYLEKEIYLATGFTYTANIRHADTTEEVSISNSLGNTYSIINLSSPLSFTPQVGDLFAIGKQNSYIREVQFDEVEFDGENYIISVHGHVPEVYSNDSTTVSTYENAAGTTPYPRPLLGAQLATGTATTFSVITGFDSLVGTYTSLTTTSIILGSQEPQLDDFFNNATLTIGSENVTILDYLGSSQTATFASPGFSSAATTGTYQISWPTASAFYGFSVAGSTSISGPFSDTGITPASVDGTVLSAVLGTSYTYYQITPYDYAGNENTTGRWVIAAGITDTTAPKPPAVVDITSSDEKYTTLSVVLDAPLERDVQYIRYRFLLDDPLGTELPYSSVLHDVSNLRDETVTTSLQTSVSNQLSALDYGQLVYGKVATVDFYGNISEYDIAFTGATLSALNFNEPTEITISESITDVDSVPGNTFTIFSGTVSGGILTDLNSVELDAFLLIDTAPTTSTTVDFSYKFGGTVTSEFSLDISSYVVGDPIWLNYLVEADTNYSKQKITGSLYTDLTLNSVGSTTAIDTTSDQAIQILASITGDTNTVLSLQYSWFKEIIPPTAPDTTDLSYTPADITDWGNVDPGDIDDAIDDLADRVTDIESTLAYHPALFYGGAPDAGAYVLNHSFVETVLFPSGLSGSYGNILTPATAGCTFTFYKKDAGGTTEFAIMTFAASGQTASFTSASGATFSPGEILLVTAPDPADESLTDLAFTLKGTRS